MAAELSRAYDQHRGLVAPDCVNTIAMNAAEAWRAGSSYARATRGYSDEVIATDRRYRRHPLPGVHIQKAG